MDRFVILINRFIVGLIVLGTAQLVMCQPPPQDVTSVSPPLSSVSSLPNTGDGRGRWCTPEPANMFSKELRWTIPFQFAGSTDWIRLHLRVETGDPQSDWWIEISPKLGTQTPERLQPSDFTKSAGRWSRRVYGDNAEVRIYSKTVLNSVSICIDAYSFSDLSAAIEPKLLIDGHTDHRSDLLRTSPQFRFGRPVALVYFQRVGAGEDLSCSGFAITSTLFITNNHCISIADQIPTAGVWYNFETDNAEAPLEIRFSELIATDPTLDYTILRLASPVNAEYIAHVSHSSLELPLPQVMQIQHPAGGRKKIAIPCSIEDKDAADIADGVSDFYHLCDASPGSSGSPIMIENSGIVIGLHNGGSTDKKTWDNHNSALKIDSMLRSIEEKLRASKDASKIAALKEIKAIN